MLKHMQMSRAVLAALVCGACAIVVAGCFSDTAVESDATACERTPEDDDGPTVAVVAQQGVAGLGFAETGHVALQAVTDAAVDSEARVVMAGTSVRPHGPLVDVRLRGEGPNELMRARALRCRTELLFEEFARISTGEPDRRLDMLSALRDMHAVIPHGSRQPIDVVLLGSVVNTEGVDLRAPEVRKSPVGSINRLARQRLNFRCDGWRVHIVGGGLAHGGRTAPVVDSQLREWWRRYFRHCGGALVFYAPELNSFPVSGGEVAPADSSLILDRNRGRLKATIADDVLFASESAVLKPGADTVLRRLLPDLARAEGRIDVDGHTDSTGPDSVNKPLSLDRAKAVAAWIRRKTDIPMGRIIVRGHGSGKPLASNETALGRARNRRVVVTIRSHGWAEIAD